MAKRRSKQKGTERKFTGLVPTGEPPAMDEADGVQVGEEAVPGMRLRCICRGHTRAIGRIAWSPCGRFIASPSQDRTIRIWDANNGNCLAVLAGHEDDVPCVEWSPTGRLLASGSQDGSFRLWDSRDLQATNSPEPPQLLSVFVSDSQAGRAGKRSWVTTLAWSSDGSRIALGLDDIARAEIWNVESKSKLATLGEGSSRIFNLAWSHSSDVIATGHDDGAVRLWNPNTGEFEREFRGHSGAAMFVAWSPDGRTVVSGSGDNTIRLWHVTDAQQARVLEGHTGALRGISLSADGRLLASKGYDETVRIWLIGSGVQIAEIAESIEGWNWTNISFHPNDPVLATHGEKQTVIRVWDLDVAKLLANNKILAAISYTSAKIVLVGESNVGKSCLAMRLAKDRYPEDHEHGTTHGMRFWPMEAEDLHPAAKAPEGQRRDVVLWDFGGQDEYQLVHQLFLHDTTLALVLIDPTRGRVAMDEARDWNKRLEKHLAGRQAVKLLVGAKQDRASRLVHRTALDALQTECGFAGYLETSAKTGRNIPDFREAIANALDWDSLAKTSRPELFQKIRDEIEERRGGGEVVLPLAELKSALQDAHPAIYEEAAVGAVADQLATQGVIVRTKLTGGDEVLVLQLPVIERYAGSLIVAARNSQRGVPAIEQRLLASPDVPLPGMKKKERLKSRVQERVVLECVSQLLIEHGICFQHEGLLIFPSLFAQIALEDDSRLGHTVSLYYDFAGAVDNIYASLVAWLVLGKNFGKVRLRNDRAEFETAGRGACGVRKLDRGRGFARMDVFFDEQTPEKTRRVFQDFVEQHLRSHGLEITEHIEVICTKCGYSFTEEDIRQRIARGENDVGCIKCDERVDLADAVAKSGKRDTAAQRKAVALLGTVEKKVQQAVKAVKQVFRKSDEELRTDEPIRILHLSDLHFVNDTQVRAKLQPLIADIEDADGGLGFERLDYLVVSGDAAHQATPAQFDKAHDFVSGVIKAFGLTAQRCILVPGNHDLSWDEEVYQWKPKRRVDVGGLAEGTYHQQGHGYLIRKDKDYPQRFSNYSDSFHHKITQEPYPLAPERQGIPYFFKDDGLQFLTLNSCWEIDEYFSERSSVHPEAVSQCLAEADRQLKRERVDKNSVLRVGVWHHPVTGNEKIANTGFLDSLRKAKVRLALHGHVHEDRTDLVGYKHGKTVHVAGAGSFGVWVEGRPPTTPQLYNVIEIDRSSRKVKVHTRYRDNQEGAWGGRAIWPGDDPTTKRTFYTV